MQDWYTRHGYLEFKNNDSESEPGTVWMKKELKQNNKDGFKD